MKLNKRDFFKALTGGAVATDALLNAASDSGVKELALPKPRQASTEELQDIGRGFFDVADAMKYDRVHFNGSIVPKNFQLFATSLYQLCGYTARTKTLAYTNMQNAGYLAPPTQMWVKRIHIFLDAQTTERDARTFGEFGWQFQILHKIWARGSCAFDAQKVRLVDLAAKLPTTAARKSLEFEYSAGLYMPMNSFFQFEFQSDRDYELDPMGLGLDIAVGLEGLEIRSVQ